MLDIKNLTVKYGDTLVVDNLSLYVKEGQWVMIVGPNGAGKSTIVNAISCGIRYAGEILFSGTNIRRMKDAERARCYGILHQNHYVGYDFSVEDVVRLGRYSYAKGLFSKGDGEEETAITSALQATGMLPLRHQSVTALSGGELQRTFLAQLLAQNPQVLILDEPTNHLDLVYQKQIFELVHQWIKSTGKSVISVVHDLSLAKSYGTYGVLMHHGRCVKQGNMEQVLKRDILQEVYAMDVYQWMQSQLTQWEDE